MKKPVTPGLLTKWALLLLVGWVVLVLALDAIEGLLGKHRASPMPGFAAIEITVYVVVAVLLIAAFIAKAVQIGVRSSRP